MGSLLALDIDECKFPSTEKVCFGVCINTIGSYDCQCPQGTYGNPEVEGGCVYYDFDDTGQYQYKTQHLELHYTYTCRYISYVFNFQQMRCRRRPTASLGAAT